MNALVLAVVRGGVIFAVVWGAIGALGKVLDFGSTWPWWVSAVIAAGGAELVLGLYRYEQGVVTPRRGRFLAGLRLAVLAIVVWILLQPVFSRQVERDIKREVVVVVDDSASMHLQDDGADRTRIELGQMALAQSGLFEALEGKVGIRKLYAARRTLGEEEERAVGWNQATDLANALATVLEQVPPDNLAGVVMITDGRHNRPGRIEDVARRFGILDAPVGILAVGSEEPPKDAAILRVHSPDAVYLGDRVRITAEVKFDGYRGKKAILRLRQGEEILEEREIAVPQDHHREEVRFRHVPDEGGVGVYQIELEAMDGERFENNNSWSFETAVTDARTNVLVVDSYPRWEFRYLRNLFYGRDKSIHLQYVLLDPDTVAGQDDPPVPASAGRAFGEARATRLPTSEEEWRKFDVIILGDLGPDALDEKTWKIIEGCVSERAALLVVVAGPRAMPHAIRSETARDLFPVLYTPSSRTYFGEGGTPFRIALTREGRQHPITAQSDSRLLNEKIWGEFPLLRWRHPVDGIKEGAQILLMAAEDDGGRRVVDSAADLGSALDRLARRREEEAARALLVTQQVGNGKVAMLLTDRTWRLREGVGDVYHHRFWGQLVRWGAGPNLRSGTAQVRLGSDAITYTGDDPVHIMARLWDTRKAPVHDSSLKAEIWRGEEKVAQVPLVYREGSNGLHEAMAGPFVKSGRYEIRVVGDEVADLLDRDEELTVTTGFRVVGARSPVELSETTLNRPLLETIAELSGGRVVDLGQLGELAGMFLEGDESRLELRETTLWDHWLLLVLLLGLLTTEWISRRGAGLP